jgi:hypothetical protein
VLCGGSVTTRFVEGEDVLIGSTGDDALMGRTGTDFCDGDAHIFGDTATGCERQADAP